MIHAKVELATQQLVLSYHGTDFEVHPLCVPLSVEPTEQVALVLFGVPMQCRAYLSREVRERRSASALLGVLIVCCIRLMNGWRRF